MSGCLTSVEEGEALFMFGNFLWSAPVLSEEEHGKRSGTDVCARTQIVIFDEHLRCSALFEFFGKGQCLFLAITVRYAYGI